MPAQPVPQGAGGKPRLAVFAGATATILNTAPLVTSNKARRQYGLPLLTDADGQPLPDVLRPQRLAAPVTVYIRQFSAHPLEADAAHLYAPPDGYLDAAGTFHEQPTGPEDVPVYRVTLEPEDGLYPLPYMARQADGSPWDGEGPRDPGPIDAYRQTFFPDAARLFEEIDRLGVDSEGLGGLLARRATFDFYRAAPPGGYRRGLPAAARTDVGEGDIPPEQLGVDYFPYRPRHLQGRPDRARLAHLTNLVQAVMASGRYQGALWLEGTPFLEETAYWLSLLVDTPWPIAGVASQRPHGTLSNDGDRNLVDAVDFLCSRVWEAGGRNRLGVVVIQDEQIFAAREVHKVDARPGGYTAGGGHGGVIGRAGPRPWITFLPTVRHTWNSAVNLSRMPEVVSGVRMTDGRPVTVPVAVKTAAGALNPEAMPHVAMVKYGRYESGEPVEILARLRHDLRHEPLAGLVVEGGTPDGTVSPTWERAIRLAVASGVPVVKVGRGIPAGFVRPDGDGWCVAGGNLSATKARLLLMAALLRWGSLTPAADPEHPTAVEVARLKEEVARLQGLFDTH